MTWYFKHESILASVDAQSILLEFSEAQQFEDENKVETKCLGVKLER